MILDNLVGVLDRESINLEINIIFGIPPPPGYFRYFVISVVAKASGLESFYSISKNEHPFTSLILFSIILGARKKSKDARTTETINNTVIMPMEITNIRCLILGNILIWGS